MSFTSGATGGNYISKDINCGSTSYALVAKGQVNYGYEDRTLVRKSVISGAPERSAEISLLNPYLIVYFWHRIS